MNRYREMEVKFDSATLTHDRFFRATKNSLLKAKELRKYKIRYSKLAEGTDVFFRLGKGVVRFRRDRTFNEVPRKSAPAQWQSVFTVKQRLSKKSLTNRKEVDIPLGDRSLADVKAFMDLLGGKHLYSIQKEYTIFMLEHPKKGIHVCLAMYDVCRPDGSGGRRFLEVEIERESACTPKTGLKALKAWIKVIQRELGLGEPVNISLFELYGRDKK